MGTYWHQLQGALVTHHPFEKDAVECNKKRTNVRKLKLQEEVTWDITKNLTKFHYFRIVIKYLNAF